MVRVATIIVNYCTSDLVIGCLRSLQAMDCTNLSQTVWVVDNASADGSADRIDAAIQQFGWDGWCQLIRLNENRGFSAGNNAAIRMAALEPEQPEFLWLLNPDTVVDVSALQTLVRFLGEHAHVGIVGSRLEGPDGEVQCSAFRFPSVLGELENGIRLGFVTRLLNRFTVPMPIRGDTHAADWVSGASMLIRQKVVEDVGLFDEGYFLYFEEVDFCRRARQAGWMCGWVAQSRVVHFVGQSTGVNASNPSKPVPAYWFESRHRYFRKHLGRFRSAIADIAWASGFALWRLRRVLQRRPDTDPPGLLRDFIWHSLHGSKQTSEASINWIQNRSMASSVGH